MRLVIIGLLLSLTFIYGLLVGKYQIFPHDLLVDIKYLLTGTDVQAKRSAGYYHKVSFFQQNARRQYDLVFVGDSITELADWQDLFPSHIIANRGIGGDTSDGVLERMDSIINTQANKAFVMIGINDISRGIDVEITFKNYQAIITQLQTANMEVVVQSVLYTDGNRLSNQLVTELNQLLQWYCKQKNIRFIELNQILASSGELTSQFSLDGIHLNGQGYQLWADVIRGEIE